MERLFPRALLECIGEGRLPEPQEVAALADKIGREAFPRLLSHDERRHVLNISRAALLGREIAA